MSRVEGSARWLSGVVVLSLIWSCGDSSRNAASKGSGGAAGEAGSSEASAGSANDAGASDGGEAGSVDAAGGARGSEGGAGGAEGGAGGGVDHQREKCVASYTALGGPNADVGAVLEACPMLADFMFWVDLQNQDVAYASWSQEMKDRLDEFYQAIMRGPTVSTRRAALSASTTTTLTADIPSSPTRTCCKPPTTRPSPVSPAWPEDAATFPTATRTSSRKTTCLKASAAFAYCATNSIWSIQKSKEIPSALVTAVTN
jgi:hypothetical protein